MAQHKIKNRVLVTIRFLRVSTKDVIDHAFVVLTTRHLTVGVVACLTTRIRQPLQLISFCGMNQSKVRIRISARRIISDIHRIQTLFEPVLEVKLLVRTRLPLN